MLLREWEEGTLETEFQKLGGRERQKAGALLSVIPGRRKWEQFLLTVRNEWRLWHSDLLKYPNCLLTLYGGVAFYEYDDCNFWPYFGKSVGWRLTSNEQTAINRAYLKAIKDYGFRIIEKERGKNYVSSAVYQIGIPLSLWDGFLRICEWAWWREDWRDLSDAAWACAVKGRVGGCRRLERYLVDNREAAAAFIEELLEARKGASEGSSLTIAEIAQNSRLRIEYFDEVPETVEFLKPADPDSLLFDKPRLVWEDRKARIALLLPGMKPEQLPAEWRVGGLARAGASTPDSFPLNGEAFREYVELELRSAVRQDAYRIRGVAPWGLFDCESLCLVDSRRVQLPLRGYKLVSREPLKLDLRGFDEQGHANEPYDLEDGTRCYITELWPTGRTASLTREGGGRRLEFRSAAKIKAELFIGRGFKSAHFQLDRPGLAGWVTVEKLPLLCVAVPLGYFEDTLAALKTRFRVLVDGVPTRGAWQKCHQDENREFFVWDWAPHPLAGRIQGEGLTSLEDLDGASLVRPDLLGKKLISINAPSLGTEHAYCVNIERPRPGMEESWRNLPGQFLLWFLLCQSRDGMSWDELSLARDIISPGPSTRHQWYLLGRYAQYGLIGRRGRKWTIAESRAVTRPDDEGRCELLFCGNPSILWGLFRRMAGQIKDLQLPVVEVIAERGHLPHLSMLWEWKHKGELETYLNRHGVCMVSNLWEA